MSSSRPVADRLEAEGTDLPGVVEDELNDAAHLLVVDTVDDSGHRHNLDVGLVQVIDGLQLHIEEVAHLAVRVGGVADAVNLEITKGDSAIHLKAQ
jgi:hypothetical protein